MGSWQSIGDDHVSVGLGIVIYDGDGRTTRRVTVNAPDGIGGRRLIVFNSVGWYAVNADGTGPSGTCSMAGSTTTLQPDATGSTTVRTGPTTTPTPAASHGTRCIPTVPM